MQQKSNKNYDERADLASALQEGEEAAYVFLMDRYYQKLCRYAYGLCRETEQAEDIVQNVMVRIWEKRHHLKPDASVRSLLYRAVYNEFLDQYKKRKSVLALEKKYIEALDTIIEEDEGKLEKLIGLIKKEIEQLSPKCKEVFLLSKKEGLTNIEIADYLNISIKTVEAQITKAFHQLRKKAGEKLDGILFLLFGKATMGKVGQNLVKRI